VFAVEEVAKPSVAGACDRQFEGFGEGHSVTGIVVSVPVYRIGSLEWYVSANPPSGQVNASSDNWTLGTKEPGAERYGQYWPYVGRPSVG